MKKYILIVFLLFYAIVVVEGQVASVGDYRTAATGNWNTLSTWQVRTGLNTWVTATALPSASNNVYIQVGHLITISVADAYCKDLHLYNNINALTLSSSFNINIYGKIRAMSAPAVAEINTAADGTYTGTSVATGFNAMIVTSGTGLMRFVGGTRNITVSGEWTSAGNTHNTEFALDAGTLGTLQTGYKGKKIIFSSGSTSITGSNLIACSQTLTDSSVVIRSGAKLTTDATGKYAIGGSSSTKCGAIYLLSGGTLEFTGATPYISTAKFLNNGTIIYSGTTQNLLSLTLQGGDVSAPLITDSLNRYTNVVFKNGTKTAVSDISVSGSFFDSAATILNMVAFKFGGVPSSVINNGTITTQNISAAPIPAGFTWGGTVTYANVLGGQTIVLGNYANLTISSTNASNPNTFSTGTIAVSETFSVAKSGTNNVIRHITTGNTINFNKLTSGQTIPAFYYNNLTVSSAATPPASNYTLAADSIYIAGVFNPGSFPNNYTVSGSTVNFNNPTGGQTIPKFNFNHLVVSNTSAPANTICVADTIGIAGIFSPGAFVNNYTTTGNTINFNSTLTSPGQTIPVFNYYNVIFSNINATTYNVLAGNINVANSLRQSGKKGLAPGINSVVYAPNATFYFTGNAIDTLYNNSPQWSDINGPNNVTLDGIFKFVFQQTAAVNSFIVNAVQLTGNIATITTASNHNFIPGSIVTIGSLSSSEYGYLFGGTFTITGTTANTFSFSLINSDIPATPVTGGVALKNVFKTITGTFKIDNSAILLVGYGNTLKMANGSTIFRNQSTSKITLNSGCLIFGNSSTDKVNVTIGNTMASDNEFAYLTNPGGYGTLKILSGTYTPSGSRTIVDLDARPGTVLDLTDLSNYTINGNILSTGTISAKPNANLIMGGANAGSSGKLLFTPGYQTLGSLKINRTGLNAEVPLGSNVSLSNYLDLTAGSLLDSGYVITNLGSIQGVSGVHVSSGSGKIMMTGANTASRAIKGGAFTVGNLDINAGSNTIIDSTTFFVAKDLTLSSGYYATSIGTYYITNLAGNLLGNSFYTGPGRIKMTGPGKKVSGVNVSNLEISLPAVADFIYASDTVRITSNLIIGSGNFRDSGKIVTVDGSIAGPGTHASINSGKIKMVGMGTISVSGIEFGNLEIASNAFITGSTYFNVNNDLTLSSGATLDLNSNIATVSGNVFGTGSQIGGAGKIKMTGSNKTISGISASNLEIATAANDSITAVGATNVTSSIGGIYLTSGKFNDGGNTITCTGNVFGPSVHNSTGNGEIKFTGAGKFVTGYPSLSNIEVAPGASLNAGFAATITGTLLMNGGNVSIGNGNLLTFKNNATIIRTTGNLNLDTGTVVMGALPSDVVNVIINGNLLSTNELPGSHIANIDLTINNGFNYTLKSNNKNVRNLNVSDGRLMCLFDTLTRSPYNLTVSDLVTVSGDFYLDSAQYDFPGNTFGPFKVGPSLIVNGNGKLKFGNVNNKTFYANGLLVLKSKNSGTASVGDVTNGGVNAGNKIIGVATVERFISNIRNLSTNSDPTVKAWRIVSMPTKHDFQTIKQAWQEGGSLNTNPNPGYGIQITSNGANWASDGFDTLSNAPSVKYFDPVSNSYGGILTTNAPFEQGKAYMVFVRGSRAKTQLGQLPDTTTLREKGSLNVGDTTVTIGSGANQFVCVANPYASSIDFWALPKTNLTSFLYLYDPRLNAYGAFQTIASNGAAVPGGGSYAAGNANIQSSQGFFVKTTTGAGTISFKETAKTDGSAMTFRNNDVLSSLRVNVFKSWNNHFELADGVMHVFDSNASNGVDEQDAVKFNNFYENIGIKIANQNLIIENRNLIHPNDTFFYQIGLRANNYQLQFIPERIQQNGLYAFLEDSYTALSTPISMTDTTWIDFTVNADALSYAANRFRLVFKQQIALPVSFTDVYAVAKNENVLVNWKVSNESNINNYKVERSATGHAFLDIGTIAASGNTSIAKSYGFTDIAPFSGINYYRIKSIGLSGEEKYSKIVKVVFNNDNATFSVAPNPVDVNQELVLDFKSIPSGKYDIVLYDFSGRKVYTSIWKKTDNNNILHIKLPSTLLSGDYRLCIKNPWDNFCESLIIR